MAGGPASHACRRGSGSTRGFNFFVLGGSFTRSGVDGTRGLGVGGLIRCAGRPREWSCGAVPPQERWHEGGLVFVFSLEVAPMSEGDSFTRSGATRRGLMRFLVLWGGAVVVWTEGGCGSMCWPVDRPATHAAAGAAARGALIFLFWGILSHAREWMAREG